jgi:hypothetical protein
VNADALQQPGDECEGSSLSAQLPHRILVWKYRFHFVSRAFAKSRSNRAKIIDWNVIHTERLDKT